MKDVIFIKGARTHNLKNITVTIPRNQLVVITGMSGSGKSSLAFDTIYAEGQRRYVESLSSYARQFLDQMEKPDVDLIEGLSPAVSVEQKAASHNPRSTVGTATELYDYLRLLFARIGVPYCYQCGALIQKQNITEIVARFCDGANATKIIVAAPVVQAKKGEFVREIERLKSLGFVRIKIDGSLFDLAEPIVIDPKKKHDIDVVIDRFTLSKETGARLHESLETAFSIGQGLCKIEFLDEKRRVIFEEFLSINNACLKCGVSYPQIEPVIFSFNSPQGACEHCSGLGELMYVDESLVVPNPKLSINQGAIVPWFGKKTNYYQGLLEALAKHLHFSLDVPFEKLTTKLQDIIFNGCPDFLKIRSGRYAYDGFFEGVKNNLMRRYKETDSDWMRGEIVRFMSYQPCPVCKGTRLKKESLAIKICDKNIAELTQMPILTLRKFVQNIQNKAEQNKEVSTPIINEILARLDFLMNVGLDYLSLNRKSHTLSGGESQRIRLASQIGSALVGVTYVLDEPSVGLHQRDNDRLISSLIKLKEIGNTVIVVEHDEDTIRKADYVIDLGPKAGAHGGEVVFAGTVERLLEQKQSITADYLTHKKNITIPATRRIGDGRRIKLTGVQENNLKNIDVVFPLGELICVTGVSGSGKSSLINETLLPALMRKIYQSKVRCGKHRSIEGYEYIDKIISIDQSPIGRTPRSNPATYTGLFTPIRELFSATNQAKEKGYKPGRFSFNVRGGRCDHCEGDGLIKIEMHFLPDVYVKCHVCNGLRFNLETLSVRYKGKNIAEILEMTVEEALVFFKNIPAIYKKALTLQEVGLGYVKLGQAATTLSGGEAQRIKLSRELSKRPTGRTVYLLDEPTTGLHFEDVKQLLKVIQNLVDHGNTVIIIEHNMHVIKTADHIIDLGPDGGELGGEIVAQGTPEEVVCEKKSITGKFLKQYLTKKP